MSACRDSQIVQLTCSARCALNFLFLILTIVQTRFEARFGEIRYRDLLRKKLLLFIEPFFIVNYDRSKSPEEVSDVKSVSSLKRDQEANQETCKSLLERHFYR